MSPTPGLVERITKTILFIRGEKILLDERLAVLYGVETRALVQAVKRNEERFPADFMFQLSPEEWTNLKSQSVISSSNEHGGRRTPPYAFTEQGVAMLSSVLRSEQAVHVNIEIMRAFVRLREILSTHHELAKTLWRKRRENRTHPCGTGSVGGFHILCAHPPRRSPRPGV